MPRETELVTRLLRVVTHRHAVEVIDALTVASRSFTELRGDVHLSRRRLSRILRVLAAEGAVRQNRPGSWDHRPREDTRYALTGGGRRVADLLSDIEVWTTLYEICLYGRPLA
ncbi:winged helix-turn-helix transcriptional regulator [Amycolatopsis sp. NBC_00345]|uniref:winged helix-turn-helix transcriptional regulator n=1 Tax=Amycolatopsis sp. NBC_00345 TaxID=2975955 RepID=UPI002E26E897